jgi:ABC-type iron transport system FetAB permease component
MHAEAMQAAPTLALSEVATAAALLLLPVAASYYMRLNLASRLAIAAARAALQLGLLAFVLLQPLFATSSPGPVCAYVLFMLLVAGVEVSARPSLTYPCLLRDALLSLALGVGCVLPFTLLFVLRAARPWWSPRVFV